jgi:hypothetical protein
MVLKKLEPDKNSMQAQMQAPALEPNQKTKQASSYSTPEPHSHSPGPAAVAGSGPVLHSYCQQFGERDCSCTPPQRAQSKLKKL